MMAIGAAFLVEFSMLILSQLRMTSLLTRSLVIGSPSLAWRQHQMVILWRFGIKRMGFLKGSYLMVPAPKWECSLLSRKVTTATQISQRMQKVIFGQ